MPRHNSATVILRREQSAPRRMAKGTDSRPPFEGRLRRPPQGDGGEWEKKNCNECTPDRAARFRFRSASRRGNGAALSLPVALVVAAAARTHVLAGGAAVRVGFPAA